VVGELDTRFPGIRERLCDDSGAIRKFINFYLNDEDIRFMDGEKTAVQDGDELAIIPAIAGGRR
jgi:molybdopterin synthase sulfur carrier subunit